MHFLLKHQSTAVDTDSVTQCAHLGISEGDHGSVVAMVRLSCASIGRTTPDESCVGCFLFASLDLPQII